MASRQTDVESCDNGETVFACSQRVHERDRDAVIADADTAATIYRVYNETVHRGKLDGRNRNIEGGTCDGAIKIILKNSLILGVTYRSGYPSTARQKMTQCYGSNLRRRQ